MPSQNLVDASPDKLSIFRRESPHFNELRNDRERSQEVVAVRTRRPQWRRPSLPTPSAVDTTSGPLAVDLPLLGDRPIRLAGAVERQFLEVFSARQASDEQVSVRLAQIGHALILQLCEEPSISRPKHYRTHMRLRQVLRVQGAFDKPAAQHGLQINGHTLDELPAAGGRPAQMMRDAHASVSSACFLPSNQTKSDFYIKNQ